MDSNKVGILLGMLFLTTFTAVLTLFKRDNSVITDSGKKLLSNKSDKKIIIEAIRKKQNSAKTSQGIIHIK